MVGKSGQEEQDLVDVYRLHQPQLCLPQKEEFVLPQIAQIINSMAGSESLCVYNRIKITEEDEEKMAFITPFGCFCYTAMTFGLRNARATYQQCVQEFLASQVGYNIHVYI
jgi:hypothetical protein